MNDSINDRMKILPAECIEDDQIIMGRAGLMKVLKVEWPYAVVREFSDGDFGGRAYVPLEGRYHVPSPGFLHELGMYKTEEEPLYVILSDHEADVLPGCR